MIGRPLSELSQVDWASLTHAYGSAEDVPAQLEAIAAGDEEAYQDAFGNLWHQWTTFSATPHAIPFLIGILETGTRNVEMLDLLGVMGRGNGEHQEAVLDALRVGVPLFRSFLWKSKSEAEARSAVYLLSSLLNDSLVSLELEVGAYKHPNPSVQAACIYHLHLSYVRDEVTYHALKYVGDRSKPALSLACALFLAHDLGKNVHPDAVWELERALLNDELEEFQEQMTIDPDDIFEEVAKAAKAMEKEEIFAAAFRAKAEATGDKHWLDYLEELE